MQKIGLAIGNGAWTLMERLEAHVVLLHKCQFFPSPNNLHLCNSTSVRINLPNSDGGLLAIV